MTNTDPRPTRSIAGRKAARKAATPGSGSELIAALERIWAKVCDYAKASRGVDLSMVHIITGSGADRYGITMGHVLTNAWRVGADDDARVPEVFISGEALGVSPERALTTVLHEAAHVMLLVEGDPASGCTPGKIRYHTGTFRAAAEVFGLEWIHGRPHGTYGFSSMELGDLASSWWADELAALAKVRATIPTELGTAQPRNPDDLTDPRWVATPTAARPAPRTTTTRRRRVAVACGCRAVEVFPEDAADLVCGRCGQSFGG